VHTPSTVFEHARFFRRSPAFAHHRLRSTAIDGRISRVLAHYFRNACVIANTREYAPGENATLNPVHTSNNVEATGNKVASCFDSVASTLMLVWTGLYRAECVD